MEAFSPLILIHTTENQLEAIDFLENMLSENFKSKPNSKKLIKSDFTKNFNSSVWSEIETHKVPNNREAIEKYAEELLAKIKDLTQLKITISAPLSDKSLQNLGIWLRKNLSQNCIFDITIDPKILGGAIVISEKGEYKDYSLLKKIDDYFQNQQLTV